MKRARSDSSITTGGGFASAAIRASRAPSSAGDSMSRMSGWWVETYWMNAQNRSLSSGHTRRSARTTSPNAPIVATDRWWSLNAMSSWMLPVELTPQSGQGQIAPNFVWPQ
jgi:hypothetical protein